MCTRIDLKVALSVGIVLAAITSLDPSAEAAGRDDEPGTTGRFLRETWHGSTGSTGLEDDATFVAAPDASTRIDLPIGASGAPDGFLQRVRGWVEVPATGSYRFAIASGGDSVLLVSPDGDPATAFRVAAVEGRSGPGRFDLPGQVSRPVTLIRGQRCYIEARHRDDAGGSTADDHLTIAWKVPRSGLDRPVPIGAVVEPRFLLEVWERVPQGDPTRILGFERKPDRTRRVVDLATPEDIGSSVATRLSGTWTAPRRGKYRFMLSADDLAQLAVRAVSEEPVVLGTARLDSWTAPDSWEGRPGQVTGEIPLEAGQAVRIEVLHSQGSGPGHAAVGVSGPGVDERPISSPIVLDGPSRP